VDDHIRRALAHSAIIDMTTVGRRSGQPRRIEIVYHVFDGRIYISGMPRHQRRSWLANLAADPRMTVHLKGTIQADLPATARIIDDPEERRSVLERIARVWNRTDVDEMVRYSPLIEVEIADRAA